MKNNKIPCPSMSTFSTLKPSFLLFNKRIPLRLHPLLCFCLKQRCVLRLFQSYLAVCSLNASFPVSFWRSCGAWLGHLSNGHSVSACCWQVQVRWSIQRWQCVSSGCPKSNEDGRWIDRHHSAWLSWGFKGEFQEPKGRAPCSLQGNQERFSKDGWILRRAF